MAIQGTFTNTGTSDAETFSSADLSITGTFVATVKLQRSFDGTNWGDIEVFTAAAERVIEPATGGSYRLTCTAYTSGTVNYYVAGKR